MAMGACSKVIVLAYLPRKDDSSLSGSVKHLRLSWVRLMASSLGSLEAAARRPGMRFRMVSIQLPPLLALAATRLSASPSYHQAMETL